MAKPEEQRNFVAKANKVFYEGNQILIVNGSKNDKVMAQHIANLLNTVPVPNATLKPSKEIFKDKDKKK